MRRVKIWVLLAIVTLTVSVPLSRGQSNGKKVTVTLLRWPYT